MFGASWYAGRALGILLTIATGVLVYRYCVAALLAVASFMPTPSTRSTSALTVPFLIVTVAGVAALVADRVRRADPQLWNGMRVAGAIVVLAYVALPNIELNGYAHYVKPIDITASEQVTDWIDARTRPGEEVLTSWPGYLLGSHAVSVPGFENQDGPVTARAIGPGGASRYGLGSIADVRRAIADRRTRLVVWQNWVPKQRNPSWISLLAHSAYRRDRTWHGVRFYVLGARPGE